MKMSLCVATVGLVGSAVVWGGGAIQDRPSTPERFTFQSAHMGTEFTIHLYCAEESTASKAAEAAFERVAELDAIYSDYQAKSELNRLSARAGGPPVPVSEELFEALQRARALSEETNGAFDVTVGPLVKLWRRARRRNQLPDPERIEAASERVGFEKMRLDPERRAVELRVEGMQLDLGGIAKGIAADEALKVLQRHGIERALVAASGDIRAGGPPPGEAGWLVGLAPLKDPDAEPTEFVRLANEAVSSSGDASQFVEVDGVRYSHIVDPRTGIGLTRRVEATVIADTAADSDSLATSLNVLDPERGLSWIEAKSGVEARIVVEPECADRPRTLRTSGFEGRLVAPAAAAEPANPETP